MATEKLTRLLYVPLSSEALELLQQRAEIERRRPQDEAAILIEQALGLRRKAISRLQRPKSDAVAPVATMMTTKLRAEFGDLIHHLELLKITGWDRTTLWNLRRRASNPLPFIKLGGRLYFRESEFLAWIERSRGSAHGNSLIVRDGSQEIIDRVKNRTL